MPAKDETRWTQNDEGAWTRRVGENEETTYVNPNATESALVAAEELGVDLSTISGTGVGGKITKGDITAALKDEEEVEDDS